MGFDLMNTYTEHTAPTPEIYSLKNVSRVFGKGKDELQVLSGVDLSLHEGERALAHAASSRAGPRLYQAAP